MSSTETAVLERDHPDPDRDPALVAENITHGRDLIRNRVPVHFQYAEPTRPEVIEWQQALVASAAHNRVSVPVLRRGPSLLIMGGTGVGKTHQAYGAINALLQSGVMARFEATTAADLYAQVRPRPKVDPEGEFQRFASVPLLLLDDLGAAKDTEWTEEINYRLIDHRYVRELPTVITSNVPPRDLATELSARVASRLTEMCRQVAIRGTDRRVNGGEG